MSNRPPSRTEDHGDGPVDLDPNPMPIASNPIGQQYPLGVGGLMTTLGDSKAPEPPSGEEMIRQIWQQLFGFNTKTDGAGWHMGLADIIRRQQTEIDALRRSVQSLESRTRAKEATIAPSRTASPTPRPVDFFGEPAETPKPIRFTSTTSAFRTPTVGASTSRKDDKRPAPGEKRPKEEVLDSDDEDMLRNLEKVDPNDPNKDMKESRQMFELMSRAFSKGLQRSTSQTPGGTTRVKSKMPEPSEYDGTKGPKAQQFINQCLIYFASNVESFPSDHSKIGYALRRMGKGLPAIWASLYEQRLANGEPDPLLRDWAGFEQGFLQYWIDPAAKQVAARKLRELKQTKSASDYSTEFQVLAAQTDFDEPSLMEYYRLGLEKNVRREVISHEIRYPFGSLQEMIREATIRDNALAEIRRIEGGSSQRRDPSTKSDFVSKELQEARRTKGECLKCGAKGHSAKLCRTGWKIHTEEKAAAPSKPVKGKTGTIEEVQENSSDSGKE